MRKPRGHPAGLDVEDGTPVLRVLSFSYKSKADAFGDSNGPGVFRKLSDDGIPNTPQVSRAAPLAHPLGDVSTSTALASSTPKHTPQPRQHPVLRTASAVSAASGHGVVPATFSSSAVSRSKSAVTPTASGRSPRRRVREAASASAATAATAATTPRGEMRNGATVVVLLSGGDAPNQEEAEGRGGRGAGNAGVALHSLAEPAETAAGVAHQVGQLGHRADAGEAVDAVDTLSIALSGSVVEEGCGSALGSACSSVAGTGTSSSLGAGASAAGLTIGRHHRHHRHGEGSSSGSGAGGGGSIGDSGWSQPRTPMGSTTQLIQVKARPQSTCGGVWSLDAALAALSLAASLGNLLRLPRLVLQYGGGSFLAVYCATSLLLGIPLALLEVGLGQLCEQGVTRVWRAVPLFTGVGMVKVALSALLAVYGPVLMALSLFFAVWTAKGPVPFNECKHASGLGLDGYVYSRSSGEACLKKTFLKSPSEEPMWFGVTATFLFLLWTIALLCVFRGARGFRRVLAVLVVTLAAGIVAVLVDSTLLRAEAEGEADGEATKGLEHLLRFDWDALLNVETWYFATIQMFFSTQLGLGNIVTGAGRFYSKSNAVWTATALVVCNLLLGVLWVAIVFLRLGPLIQPNQLRLVSSDIPETMVLTLLYDSAARGDSDQYVAAVGFLVIVCAGFASLVPLLDTILSAIYVETKRRWEWWKAAAVCCICGFILGALCMIPDSLSLIHVLDHYVVGRLVLACTVTELVAFVWIYGCGPLYTDLEFVVGSKLGPIWKILWCLAPLYLLAVEAWSVIVMPWDGIPGRHDPAWQVLLGWGLYFAGWAIICVTALRQVCIQVDYNICQKFLSAVKPSRNWGPSDPIYRHCWMQWRDATPANKMDQTLRRRGTRDYTHSVRMATAPDPLAHFSHLSASRGSGPFFIDSKAELAEHVCWRKEIHEKTLH